MGHAIFFMKGNVIYHFIFVTLIALLCCKMASAQDAVVLRTMSLPDAVQTLDFSPDGKTLAVGTGIFHGSKGGLFLCDVSSGKILKILQQHKESIAVVFSPNGELLAAVCGDWMKPNAVRVWNVKTGRLMPALSFSTSKSFRSVLFSPDGRTLAAGSGYFGGAFRNEPARVTLWDIHTRKIQRVLRGLESAVAPSYLAFSSHGALLAGIGNDDEIGIGQLGVWDLNNGRLRLKTDCEEGAHTLRFSPDDSVLFCGITKFNLRKPKSGFQSRIPKEGISDTVAISPKGNYLVASSSAEPGLIKVWDANIKRSSFMIRASQTNINALCFSRQGDLLATGSNDKKVKVWIFETIVTWFGQQAEPSKAKGDSGDR